ncbi:zinc ribbon domain-containing protein [Paenibacillaceae bacterium WGS1546]|uniref:zinc ribbon domain-containing protein n=1 Tax=Cohnella sp. WGS1546 TaxID=3366810 RepID=UPI00372D731B
MKPCTDCGNVISRRAEVCPHCGVRHNTHPVVFYNVIMIGLVLLVGLFVFISRL